MPNSIKLLDHAVQNCLEVCPKLNRNGVNARILKKLIRARYPELESSGSVNQYTIAAALRRAGYRQKLGYIPVGKGRHGGTGKFGRVWYPKNDWPTPRTLARPPARDSRGRWASRSEETGDARP